MKSEHVSYDGFIVVTSVDGLTIFVVVVITEATSTTEKLRKKAGREAIRLKTVCPDVRFRRVALSIERA